LTQAATAAQYLTALGFVALGVAIGYRWYRDRGRAEGMLAGALISLAAVSALGRIPNPPLALSIVSLVLFMLSGFFVLLFRNEFVPLGRTALYVAYGLLAFAILVGTVDLVAFSNAPPLVVSILGILIVTPWAIFVGEPIVRFWIHSNRLPAVQKARMRFLSAGFGLLIAVIFVAVIAGSALRSPTAVLLTQLVALLAVPVIYVSFAPPSLLRRIWRLAEENEIRAALQDLLIFSPTRQAMAERAVYWAARMMGATSGFVTDAEGNVLATTGVEPGREKEIFASPHGTVISAPLHLTEGQGTLAVVAGTFTPVFGSEEVSQLVGYANAVAAGLERARVTERMTALEDNKTQFLNLASHELRGPVTVIRGYVSMLEGGLLGELNDRGRTAAGVMAAKVSEMNELIEEMIEAARLEEGGVTLRAVETDLRDVARAAADVVKPLLDASHRLEMDLPDRRVWVKVDPDRTKTIVANLLSNAIKYSPDGGTVTCQVRSRAGVARVAVIDEGLGISHESMGKLFTRFGRIITPETEHLKGTGLGLFLARQLARLQGGDITVASVEGEGSTFTLQLPLAGAAPPDGASDGGLEVAGPAPQAVTPTGKSPKAD
jgi:signal transduction histidine kinase